MAQHLGARLAHLSQREDGGEAVIPIKLLARPARGSGARAAHGLRSSAQLQFAEQVQVSRRLCFVWRQWCVTVVHMLMK